jgi:hypothetical protein
MSDLSIKIDAAEFERRMMTCAKQIPYAMAASINLVLFEARPVIQAELPKHFTIRTPYTQKGVHISTATKRNLTGAVGFLSSRWWMPSQVEGGSARKKPGDKPIWQPLATGPRSPRPDWNKAIPAARRPNVAGAKTPGGASKGRETKVKTVNAVGYFKVITGAKIWPGIYYRPSDLSRKIKAAYWLEPHENIKARYDLSASVNRVVAQHWAAAMEKGIKRALETAR